MSTSCLCGSYGGTTIGGGAKSDQELLDEATDLPVCDYDENPTPLYKAMEQHQWGAVSRFLKTGVWPGCFFSDRMTPKEQVRTWIHRFDDSTNEIKDDGTNFLSLQQTKSNSQGTHQQQHQQQQRHLINGRYLRWRQLPLHASLIFLAPPIIVKQLIEAFPYALRCPDDKGMLPLHLAFRQAVPDDILTILLRLFPNGMHVRDQKGRLPVECVRDDVLHAQTAGSGPATGAPPVRGMIIQSIMQQSKEKFSQQQQETIQSFQHDMKLMQSKLQSLEKTMQAMNDREQTTREELHMTLDQLNSLKKNHRRLQELQRFALQKQSEQEVLVDQQAQSFQQRVMEQLDLQLPPSHSHKSRAIGASRSRSRGRSRDDRDRRGSLRVSTSTSRGRAGTRRDVLDTPREAPPPSPSPHTSDSPVSVTREDSRGYTSSIGGGGGMGLTRPPPPLTTMRRRRSGRGEETSQSSFEDDEEEEQDTPSYSSGISRFSEFTKGIPNAYTTGTAYTGKSGITTRGGGVTDHSSSRNIFKNQSYNTKATAASGTTYLTQNDPRIVPLHSNQSIFDKRRQTKGIARAIYPIRPNYESSTDNGDTTTVSKEGTGVNSKTNKKGVGSIATATANNQSSMSNCNANSPGSFNWDFSFTPGFLQPLSINEL